MGHDERLVRIRAFRAGWEASEKVGRDARAMTKDKEQAKFMMREEFHDANEHHCGSCGFPMLGPDELCATCASRGKNYARIGMVK